MKTILFLGLIILMTIGGCRNEKKSPVEGIWKLVSGRWFNWYPGDTLVFRFPGNMSMYHIKIYSKDNFTFVGHYNLGTTTNDNYGGGTYSLKGDRYEENILYAGKASVNRKVRMIMEVKNDTLVQKWPADKEWKLADKYSIEKYVRLK
jgi:hypothetical protein